MKIQTDFVEAICCLAYQQKIQEKTDDEAGETDAKPK